MKTARYPPVLRQTNFRRFFIGQSTSLLGDQIAILAIPLTAVLVLHAGPRSLGTLTALAVVPSLVFSIIFGTWVDSSGRRRAAMLLADLARGMAVLSIPIASGFHVLTLLQLYVVAFLLGTLDVLFAVAQQALVVSVVGEADFVSASTLLHGSQSVAGVVGLSAGGSLVALLSAPGALALDALSFLFSGLQLARLQLREKPGSKVKEHRRYRAGFKFVAKSSVLGPLLASAATINFFAFVGYAMLVLYANRTLHLDSILIGIAFGAGAIGGVVGASTFGIIQRVLPLGRLIIVGSFIYPLALFLYPVAHGGAATSASLLLAGEFISAVAVVWLDISIGTVFVQEIPSHLMSRVSGVYRTINYGVRPLGALAGGFLGESVGLRTTLLISASGAVVGAILRLRPSVAQLRVRTGPSQEVK